jgi:hypothetical protein
MLGFHKATKDGMRCRPKYLRNRSGSRNAQPTDAGKLAMV